MNLIQIGKQKLRLMLLSDLRYSLLVKYEMPRLYNALSALRTRLYGSRVRVDASSVCQLRCPACSTSKRKNRKGVVGWGFLKFESFKKLLQENPDIKSVELSNWGEIFLNPDLLDIIRYAHERKVTLKASNGVNFNRVNNEMLEALVKYRFRYISISIDGASQSTYQQYRVRGDFKRVMKNIRKLNRYKAAHRTKFPRLSWQFIVFGHNEHELPKAREMARELGMAFRPKLNHTPGLFPVQNDAFVSRESGFGAASREDFRKKSKREYSFPCGQMWDYVQINWDGKMLGCCVNKYGDFGNVFEEGLEQVMRSERYEYAKQMILGKLPPREDIPCSRCKTYRRMLAEKNAETT